LKILVFGIHPDDIELGCGGTVILAGDQGHDVVLADLSDGAASSNGTVEQRRNEAEKAGEIMGVRERINLELPDTGIRAGDPAQLARVVSCVRGVRPDLALAPTADDPHPDHLEGAQLVQRALYFAGVHGYEPNEPAHRTPGVLVYAGRREMNADLIADISDVFERKLGAVRAHDSQFGSSRGNKPTPLNAPDFFDFIEARARVYGRQVGARYGEPFETGAPIRLNSLDLFARPSNP
jgi:bacillithiol biosynthesis deacetylase BshB1